MKSSNTILGLLSGVAVGAAIGILLAPDKGTNTRKKLSEKSNDTKKTIINSFKDILESISQSYDSIESKAGDLIEEGKDEFNSVKNQLNK